MSGYNVGGLAFMFQRKDSSNSSSISGSTPTEHITTQTNPLGSIPDTPVHRGTIRNSVEGLNQEIERLVLRNTSLINVEREEDRLGSIPDTPVHRGTIRNSVEGLNQEIERLVLRNTSLINVEREEDRDISEGHRAPLAEILGLTRSVNTQTPGDRRHHKRQEKNKNMWMCVLQDISEGHRAPLAEILGLTRSVNTQTPGENFTPSSLSSGPPSRGEAESPLGPRPLAFSRPASEDSSPGAAGDGEPGSKSGASPKINKFLAREPPDGCEKVNLKFIEDSRKPMCDLSLLEDYPPLKPSLTFTLRPSTGSAFYSISTNSDLDATLAPRTSLVAETGTDEASGSGTKVQK
ncbi:uncharacterized protein LOC103524421 [Diaphorina citri]|uniref:Uncharacterized protein LOC103524421 n=1 Tax=Diaphorina citri TaxID=121845 RepID=A0A3Q0JLR5_DIACI|nr:uncharacterized protein LOC103524421 [Diaphorina citri]